MRPGSVAAVTTPETDPYPGQRLGFPASGPGSVAGWGRRALALVGDWFVSRLVAGLLFGSEVWTGNGTEQLTVFAVFLFEATLFTALAGGSFGQLAMRLAVVRLDHRSVTILQALVRTFLILLVIPPLVFNRDNRGLHDLAVNTVVVRR